MYKINPFTGRMDWSSASSGSGGNPEFGEAVEMTISGGIVATTDATKRNLLIDTEGDAASDDLDNITGYSDGDVIVIRPANDDRTVVVKDSGDNTKFNLQSDFTMNSVMKPMVLLNLGSDAWLEVTRASSGT